MSYSPTLGRFLETDPARYIDGPNLYQMEDGRPTNLVDPLGLDPKEALPGGGHLFDRPRWDDPIPRSGSPVIWKGGPNGGGAQGNYDHITWAIPTQEGTIAHYVFTWEEYDCPCNGGKRLTGLPSTTGSRYPGETPGRSEYYVVLGNNSGLAILNGLIGGSGRGAQSGAEQFLKSESPWGKYGWMRLDVEIKQAAAQNPQTLDGKARYAQSSYNNTNQVFLPGGILSEPTVSAPPTGWAGATTTARYQAALTWSACTGSPTYSYSWNSVTSAGKDSGRGSGRMPKPPF